MNKPVIEGSTEIVQKKKIYLTDLDQDKVMMDLDSGNYFVLNDIAGQIWEAIKVRRTVDNIIQDLIMNYDVEENLCRRQVIEYLNQLYSADLVLIRNA